MSAVAAEVISSARVPAAVAACAQAAKEGTLIVIADFDRTLTSCWVNGQRGSGAHSVLATAGVLSEQFQKTVSRCWCYNSAAGAATLLYCYCIGAAAAAAAAAILLLPVCCYCC